MMLIKILLKIAALPAMLILKIIRLLMDIAARLSSIVLGPVTLFVFGCIIYTIIKQEWSQTFLLILIEIACYGALFGAGVIATEISILGDKLVGFIRS